jgi:hypothetical protein
MLRGTDAAVLPAPGGLQHPGQDARAHLQLLAAAFTRTRPALLLTFLHRVVVKVRRPYLLLCGIVLCAQQARQCNTTHNGLPHDAVTDGGARSCAAHTCGITTLQLLPPIFSLRAVAGRWQ